MKIEKLIDIFNCTYSRWPIINEQYQPSENHCSFFRLFNRYKEQIILFHFARHANRQGLQFNQNFTYTTIGHATGSTELLGREAKEDITSCNVEFTKIN